MLIDLIELIKHTKLLSIKIGLGLISNQRRDNKTATNPRANTTINSTADKIHNDVIINKRGSTEQLRLVDTHLNILIDQQKEAHTSAHRRRSQSNSGHLSSLDKLPGRRARFEHGSLDIGHYGRASFKLHATAATANLTYKNDRYG